MKYITPYNNYALLTPSGDIIGFLDIDECKDYVTGYDLVNMIEFKNKHTFEYFDFYDEQDQKDYGTIEGVNSGQCQIYDIEELIEAIREASIFQSEKDEIINKLLCKDIDLNIYEIGIDDLVSSVDAKWNC